jgi:hypothetical protein
VIEMTDDEFSVAKRQQPIEKRDRIAAAGYADKVWAGGRETRCHVRIDRKFPHIPSRPFALSGVKTSRSGDFQSPI